MPNARRRLSVRLATIEDADALSDIEVLARPTDPSWTYRYPYREEYRDDHRKFNRAKYDSLFDESAPFQVVLAETQDASGKMIPVGVSIWKLDNTPWYKSPPGKGPVSLNQSVSRRDEHPMRRAKMVEVHDRGLALFLSPTFGVDKYLYLMIIAVHPDYQGTGAATAMTAWGMDLVKQYPECKLGVCSSQVDKSRRLWDTKLGFRSVGAAVARAEEDEEKLEMRMEFFVWP